ncbi:phage portal protein%2C SPP1 family [Streptococcus suis]|uniref:Phage portal protein, SPP1 family n=1 Tax=Streptococcus suis TaxID=1307 RepID=A0A0Z8PJB8_STRSU|nr:phage portal protein%2C SPP1 family [Streptococcus suis]
MEETLVYSRSLYNEQNLDKDIIYKLILKHDQTSSKLKKLKDYYLGKHAIEKHTRRSNLPNFKTVANPPRTLQIPPQVTLWAMLSVILRPTIWTLKTC